MTTLLFPERTAQVTVTTGTGTLTLGAAISGHQALVAGANTRLLDYFIEASDGAWEVVREGTYTHSGTTLTRGTFVASSTGSVISLAAGTHTVRIGPIGSRGNTFSVGSSNLVTVGALNAGSITSGFGAIDIGGDALTAGAGSFTLGITNTQGGGRIRQSNAAGTLYTSLVNDGVQSVGTPMYFDVEAGRTFPFAVAGTGTIATISSTGLAVTGSLSSTTGANFATSSGNVGIGTASPDIVGSVASRIVGVRAAASANAIAEIQLIGDQTTGTNTTGRVIFGQVSGGYHTSEVEGFRDGADNSQGIRFKTFSSGSMAERLRLTSAGNVLIGTTTTVADPGILTLSKGITFPATQVASADANTLDDYREASYTATATGLTTSPTGTVSFVRVGNLVTMNIPGFTGTSNDTAFTLTGMPTTARPSGDRIVPIRVIDNGAAQVWGLVIIPANGVMDMRLTPAGGAFTASGTKTVAAGSFSYTI